jgi:hypothetical protein
MFTLDQVVPWGRSFDEYRLMFALSDKDLRLRILGCADGPASFNAIATRRRAHVVSCDPLYRFSASEIRDRIAATYETIIEQTRKTAGPVCLEFDLLDPAARRSSHCRDE